MASQDKEARQEKLHTHKRRQILDAAAALFAERGLESLTMRAIAEAAGYSLGAAYAYYSSKEEIQADLFAGTLSDLGRVLRLATPTSSDDDTTIKAAFTAFHEFFRTRPEHRQLALSLFGGAPASGASDALINSRLIAVLGFLANVLNDHSDLTPAEAQAETVAAVAYLAGLTLMAASGRLALLGQAEEEMVDRYMDQMLRRTEQ